MHSAKAVLKLAFFKGGNARIHGFRDRKVRYKVGGQVDEIAVCASNFTNQ
jgi:hypothetical protein